MEKAGVTMALQGPSPTACGSLGSVTAGSLHWSDPVSVHLSAYFTFQHLNTSAVLFFLSSSRPVHISLVIGTQDQVRQIKYTMYYMGVCYFI